MYSISVNDFISVVSPLPSKLPGSFKSSWRLAALPAAAHLEILINQGQTKCEHPLSQLITGLLKHPHYLSDSVHDHPTPSRRGKVNFPRVDLWPAWTIITGQDHPIPDIHTHPGLCPGGAGGGHGVLGPLPSVHPEEG